MLYPGKVSEFIVSGKKKKPNFPNFIQNGQYLFKIKITGKDGKNENIEKEIIFSSNFSGSLLEISHEFLKYCSESIVSENCLKTELMKKNHFFLIFQPKKRNLHEMKTENMNYEKYLEFCLKGEEKMDIDS